MKSLNITYYLVAFSVAIIIVNSINLFGDNQTYVKDDGTATGINAFILSIFPKDTESVTADIIAMTTFSLLIYVLSPVLGFLIYSVFLLNIFLPLLGIPLYFTMPLTLFVNIVFIMGYNQFKARQSFQGLE